MALHIIFAAYIKKHMKKIKIYFLAVLVSGSLVFSSCTDDSDPDPTAGTTCKIMSSTDDDGETITYTYDGDNLVKIVEKDSFGSYTTDFIYEGGKLTSVEEDQNTTFEVIYNGSEVSRVNERDFTDKELYGYHIYTYSNGVVSKMEIFEVFDAPETDSLMEQYDFVYANGSLSKIDLQDRGDAGVMESSGSINITGVDDKINPFYLFPTMASSDYDDFSILMKNNITSATLVTPFGNLPFAISYEYNEHGYPVKSVSSVLGETSTTTITYNCN
jgi:hypothetical protein